MSKSKPNPEPALVRVHAEHEYLKTTLLVHDRATADQVVKEFAAKYELREGYVRWRIIRFAQIYQQDQLARIKALYDDTVGKADSSAPSAAR
jgi:hypothetical protein